MAGLDERMDEYIAAGAPVHDAPDGPSERDYVYIAERVSENITLMHPDEDGYEGRGLEDVMAMARLHVYRHLVAELESFPDTARHLEQHDRVVDALGLDEPRSRETIRLSWNEQFEHLQDRIRSRAYDLRDSIGWCMDGVLTAMGVDDESQSYAEFSEEGIRQSAKEDAYERIRPILTDVVDFERADNVSVPSEDLTDYAAWLVRRREMTPESMNAYVADEELDEAPFDPETYRRALRNKEREKMQLSDGGTIWMPPMNPSVNLNEDYGGTDDWHSTTEEGIGRFVEELKDEGVIDGEVPVCIDGSIRDYHKHPDGADNQPTGVYRESHFQTNYGWKDITATAIIDGRAVVLANISMVPGDDTAKAVRYLIDRSLDLVDVEAFYADSAFASVANCRYIEQSGEDYVFKMRHTSGVKDELDEFTGKADYTEYELEEGKSTRVHTTNLIAVEKRGKIDVKRGETRHDDHSQAGFEDFDINQPEGQLTFDDIAPDDDVEYVAFLTNKEVNSAGIDPALKPVQHDNERTVWGLAERYRRRWSIETAFRQVKYQFIPQTRSRDLGTRRFVWMMGMLLLNAWAVLNIFVREWASQTFDEDDGDPPVPGKEMLEELAKTEHG